MSDAEPLLQHAIIRSRRRLLPFLLFMYIVSFLDRANIGFAKQALLTSAHVSDAAFALGAGLFFLTYAFFETPSNLVLHRVGARIWLARIMVVWGFISAATLFTTGPRSFCFLRLLLGAAEGGFFPGVILYLTYWFPNRIRGQMMGIFYLGVPLAFVLGAPLSGFLLDLHIAPFHGFLHLQGWQWMFLVEGLLAVIGGVMSFLYLDDKPDRARWLPEPEKQALLAVLTREENERRAHGPSSLLATFGNPRVLYFALIYFLIQVGVYGVVFYLPSNVSIILGTSIGLRVGIVSAVPWVFSVAATFGLPLLGDRYRSHRLVASLTLLASSLAIFLLPIAESLIRIHDLSTAPAIMALLALCVAASGLIAVQPLFWTFPTGFLSGSSAAAGIALISALGNLGGFVAPNIKVWAEAHFHTHFAGPFSLAVFTLPGALLIAMLNRRGPHPRAAAPDPELSAG
ncbi:MFS transporter [Paracidobacterium acidisoli]|uniref:MFS transporter n=1 Tax=Paracidobacterium acidisoli TaxID=2303751 RepID=A0A372IS78_9BACT|nr:MFS transporter [Paracidobacterium acidisoli]MBT9330723.1 MFS transporter [Paracidobacterium acidisoli]